MAYIQGPFNGPHMYLQWGGTLPGGDQWSCGLRMAPTAAYTPENSPTQLATAAAAVEAFHTRADSMISPRAVLTFTKFNLVDVNGHYAAQTTQEHAHANLPGAGVVAATPVNQVALAVSLVTGFSRGPAHRGRFFLPLPAISIQADGTINDAAREMVRSSAQTFIDALNGVSTGLDVAVFSRKLGQASHRVVTGIEIGSVLDTQRRRRNKLKEKY